MYSQASGGAVGAPPRFVVVDPSLRDFVGHHHAYDHAVVAAAARAGFAPLVLAHAGLAADIAGTLPTRSVFRRDIWARHPVASLPLPGLLRHGLDALLGNRDHLADLRRALAGLPLPAGSRLFAHMVSARQVLGLAAFAAAPPAPLVLLLRYQAAQYANPIGALAFRLLERAVGRGAPVRLATDSDRLAEEFATLTSLPFEVLPIPHGDTGGAGPAPGPPKQPGRLRCVSLGNARDEKGFLDILAAIQSLHAAGRLGGFDFVLQANDAAPALRPAIDALAAARLPHVTLLPDALPPAAYGALLESADLVLTPYWRSIYASRTSGVALEAMAAGKPLIVTADTWMDDQLTLHGAGLRCPERNPAALAEALCLARVQHATLAETAAARQAACRATHNPDALLARLVAPPPAHGPPKRPPERLAVFYPWDDLHGRTSGAARRTGAMLDALAPQVASIRVLQRGKAPTVTSGNVRIVAHRLPRRALHRIAFLAFARPLSWLAGRVGEEEYLWFHWSANQDARLRRHVRAMVRQADAVLLDYSFWGGPVLEACAAEGIPCVLTCHDILTDQVTGSALLRRLTERRELAAWRGATAIVCVSPADRAVLASHGLDATLAPNPVDIARLLAPLPSAAQDLLRDRAGLDLPDGPFCLFVGSRFPANLAAVESIRRVAAMLEETGPTPPIVIVGGCAPVGRQGAVQALGVVEEAVLLALYRLRPIVLVPLPHGTGTSVKTIEAMAASCAVIATAAGFRGLPVTHGQDGLLAETATELAAAIRRLLADPELRERIGAAGRQLAAVHDAPAVFAAYRRVLGLPEPTPTPAPVRCSTTTSAVRSDCR